MRPRAGIAVLALVSTVTAAAQAQPSGQDVATAQALFDEGKRLMAAGKYVEACPKLAESQRIDPGGGTLMAMALCHEAEGKTATAWAEFGLAQADARRDRRADREAAAAEHMRALETKLTKLRVVAPPASIAGLEIKRDGARIGEAQWGTPLPIDPGTHAFEASAPGKVAWKKDVEVRGEGTVVDLNVPVLGDAAIAPAKLEAPPAPAKAPAEERPSEISSQKVWGIVTGSTGLVVTGVGLGFALSASSKWSQADRACPGGTCFARSDQELGADAGTMADVATVMIGVGAAAILAGAVLWLTAPGGR